MLLIMGTVRFPADNMERARPAMRAMVEASRAESGCLHYAFAEDVLDPGLINIAELWEGEAALAAHGKTPHMAEWRRAGAELGIAERKLNLYETGDGKAL